MYNQNNRAYTEFDAMCIILCKECAKIHSVKPEWDLVESIPQSMPNSPLKVNQASCNINLDSHVSP